MRFRPGIVQIMILGKAIVKLRKSKRHSQAETAQKAGIDESYLSRIENGRINPGIEIIERIGSVFNWRASRLLKYAERLEKDSEARPR